MIKRDLENNVHNKKLTPGAIINLVILLIILIAIPFSLFALKTIQDNRGKAALGTANLHIFPSTITSRPGESKSVQVWLDPGGTPVSSVQLILKYNPSIINVTNITPGSFFTAPNVGTPLEIIKDLSTAGTVSYAVSFPLSQSQYSSTSVAPVAEIFYTGVADGSSPISFELVNQPVTKVSSSTGENALNSANGGTVSITSVGYLSFGPIQPVNPQAFNQQFQADLLLDTGNQNVSGVDAKMTFNPSFMQVVSITQSPTSPFASYPEKIFDNTSGTISISANLGSGSSPTPVNGRDIKLATIVFRAGAVPSLSSINFQFTPGDRNDSNIVLYNATQGQETQDILGAVGSLSVAVSASTNPTPTTAPSTAPTATNTPSPLPTATRTPTPVPTAVPTATRTPTPVPTAAPTATRTPTPVPTGAPTATNTPTLVPTIAPTSTPVPGSVAITISAQGRRRIGALAPSYFKVTVKTTAGATVGVFTSPASTFAQTVSLVPGNYLMLVESPGYLARKFGTTSSPIVVGSGNQSLDLTQYPLFGGDFNADGVVNEVDYTLMFLTRFSTSDVVVDLDGSGKVNNLDYDIMRSNWGLIADTL